MAAVSKTHQGSGRALAVWALVFATGWFVMLTELVGARVLSPYFGNSIYVWGSVIAIFLLALAVGYAIGGRLTRGRLAPPGTARVAPRRMLSPIVPATCAAVAGFYVALTPLYHDSLSAALFSTGMHAKWAALIATTILYAVPMALCGAISPFMIQLATKTHGEAGSRAAPQLTYFPNSPGTITSFFALSRSDQLVSVRHFTICLLTDRLPGSMIGASPWCYLEQSRCTHMLFAF